MISCENCGSELRERQTRFCSPVCSYSYRADPAQIFWSHVDQSGDCWLWTGSHDRRGYGRAWDGQKVVVASRLAWILATGATLSHAQEICHRCDNPPCVNPAHLFLGDRQSNVADAVSKHRMPAGHRHWTQKKPERLLASKNAKFTRADIEQIRAEWRPGMTKAIAERYGVHVSSISNIIQRRTWATI